MIRIEMNITCDKPLTVSEEARIAEAIRKILQPTVVTAACTQVRDALSPEYDAEHIRSQHLSVETSISIILIPANRTLAGELGKLKDATC